MGRHYDKLRSTAPFAKFVLEAPDILCRAGSNIGIGNRRGRSLVFEPLARMLHPGGDVDAWEPFAHKSCGLGFVRRVDVRVKKRNRDGLDLFLRKTSAQRV